MRVPPLRARDAHMPRVDCWRLLGISPEAGPAEVRAAFARRARDAHPDGGGTGDGLTLRLLAEARDEALAFLRERTDSRLPLRDRMIAAHRLRRIRPMRIATKRTATSLHATLAAGCSHASGWNID